MDLMSATIGNLAQALALAQSEFKPAIKDVKNTFFKSSYADLANIVESSRTALTKHGLAVMQVVVYEAEKTFLRTILAHKSGEYISGLYLLKPVKDDPQGVGSAITYARRYAYAAICGVVTEDDDGEAAQGRSISAPAKILDHKIEPSITSQIYTGTPEQKVWLKDYFDKHKVNEDDMKRIVQELRGKLIAHVTTFMHQVCDEQPKGK